MIPGPGMFIVIFQGGSRQANVLMRCNECIPICRQIAQAPGASDSSPALSLSGPKSELRACNLESDEAPYDQVTKCGRGRRDRLLDDERRMKKDEKGTKRGRTRKGQEEDEKRTK